MPYQVVKVPGGFKVKKKQVGRPRYYSTKPLTKETATNQLKALYLKERVK